MGILLTFITPPLQTPDDLNHFYRSFQIAEGHFSPIQKDKRLGGEMPLCFNEFIEPFEVASGNEYYRTRAKDISHAFDIKLDLTERQFKDFPNTSYYSAISYIPQVAALFVLTKAGVSMGVLYYGGRLAVFVFWLLCMFMIIKMLPVYKWLFTLLILLPMNVYIANSYSADNITNILSFLLIALVLKYSFADKKISIKNLLFVLGVAVLLAFAKIIYVALIFLLFTIPAQKFKSQYFRWFGLGAIITIAFGFGFIWSNVIMKYYVSYLTYNPLYKEFGTLAPGADYHLQKAYSIAHPSYFFEVILKTLTENPHYFLTSYIGGFGTFLSLFMPVVVCVICYLFIIYVATTEKQKVIFSFYQRLIFFGVFCATLLLLLLSQHLTWNKVGNDAIDCFQGRYLTPIFPLVFMMFNSALKTKTNTSWLVIPFVVFLNLFACRFMFKGFVKEFYYKNSEFFCDVETISADNKLETNIRDISLGGAENRSNKAARSGKYSVMLTPNKAFAFNFDFEGLDKRDMIEVEAWQMGEGAQLVVSGNGGKCGEFYFPNKKNFYKDNLGWFKMHMVFGMWYDCGNSKCSFYIYNSGSQNVYIDDVRFSLKKFKSQH